jgi:hypothetical protein
MGDEDDMVPWPGHDGRLLLVVYLVMQHAAYSGSTTFFGHMFRQKQNEAIDL